MEQERDVRDREQRAERVVAEPVRMGAVDVRRNHSRQKRCDHGGARAREHGARGEEHRDHDQSARQRREDQRVEARVTVIENVERAMKPGGGVVEPRRQNSCDRTPVRRLACPIQRRNMPVRQHLLDHAHVEGRVRDQIPAVRERCQPQRETDRERRRERERDRPGSRRA